MAHTWNLVQMNEQSDPICGSGGCVQFKHPKKPLGYPINYPVPNLGQDLDVYETTDSIATAQKMYNHKLEMGTPYTRAKWHNPAKDTLYNFHPELDSDIKITHNSARVASGSLGLGGKW